MPMILSLSGPVGSGQANNPDDVYALDNALRETNAYDPPPEYAHEPQRHATAPMNEALERFQENEGLKVDGYAKPGGPTERAINNRLLEKPRGAGLLFEPLAELRDKVGNGFANDWLDVRNVKRGLGALSYLPEDPFDRPHGLIDESSTKAVKNFQADNGLKIDGWLGPGGETEATLRDELRGLAVRGASAWRNYWQRESAARSALPGGADSRTDEGVVPAFQFIQIAPPVTARRGVTESRRGGLWVEPIPPIWYDMLPPSIAERTPPSTVQLPRRQYLTNPGDPRPFDRDVPESTVPRDSDPLEQSYGYTDEFDLRQWIDQQARMHRDDREANTPIPGNERDGFRPPRSGFQGVPEGERFRELKFDGPLLGDAERVIGWSRGKEPVKQYNRSIVEWLEKLAKDHDCKVAHSGGSRDGIGEDVAETWLGPRVPTIRSDGTEDKISGGARADITFSAPKKDPNDPNEIPPRLFINTVDRTGIDPKKRESESALRILANSNSRDLLLMVPKLRKGEALDLDALRSVVSALLDRLCSETGSTTNRMTIYRGILQPRP